MNKEDFTCTQCSNCCKIEGYAYVTQVEIEQIAAYLNFEIPFFLDHYCDIIRPRFSLKSFENGACFFLNDYGCIIYDVRPQQCKDFPHKWKTKDAEEYCKGLRNSNIEREL